jgi:glycosyltransferase involved in cell wall biosynthesis
MRDTGRKKGRLRLGILVSHPIQYFAPVYRELAQRPDIDLTVIYRTRVGVDAYHDVGFGQMVQWDLPLIEGYKSKFLSGKTVLRGLEPRIVRLLLQYRFDVLVIHGYNYATNLLGLAVAKLAGAKVLLRGDTRLQERHLHASAGRRWVKQRLIGLFDGFLAIGSLNRAYYLAYGAQEERVFFAPFCVDNAVFSLTATEATRQRASVREDLGLPQEAVVVLYASKLTPRKRAMDLLDAFSKCVDHFPNAWLVIAGAGEQLEYVKARAGSVARVRVIGFQNQSALPGIYAASDLFVLPSQGEPWGLVVNEVMAAGLPVVVSDEVGAAPDLVLERETGIVYRCGDVDALVAALCQLLGSVELRATFSRNARVLIGQWDVSECAAAIADAAHRIVSST